jgi:hypothetical protein
VSWEAVEIGGADTEPPDQRTETTDGVVSAAAREVYLGLGCLERTMV